MAGKVTDFTAITSPAASDVFYVVQTSDNTDKKITASNLQGFVAGVPSGAIMPFGMSTAPSGWLLADGSAVSRTTYANLFSAIGVTWGSGDGSTTFNLPDLRGAFVRGAGSHGSETMADGNAYAGPAVGSYEDDQMQGHVHFHDINGTGYTAGGAGLGFNNSSAVGSESAWMGGPATDGVNGTPRTGDETRPFAAGVYYCIKT